MQVQKMNMKNALMKRRQSTLIMSRNQMKRLTIISLDSNRLKVEEVCKLTAEFHPEKMRNNNSNNLSRTDRMATITTTEHVRLKSFFK